MYSTRSFTIVNTLKKKLLTHLMLVMQHFFKLIGVNKCVCYTVTIILAMTNGLYNSPHQHSFNFIEI